jgi:hypothetical protein
MAQWKSRKKYKRLHTANDRKPSTKEEMDNQDAEDTKLYKSGELLSCENVGPVNAKSLGGYTAPRHSSGETRRPSACSHTRTAKQPRKYT